MDAREFIDFLKIAEKLKDRTRHCYTSGGRHESVAEHCFRAAMMADLLRKDFPEADMDKVVRMLLWHDMGEAVTGDIPVFQKTKEDTRTEDKAVEWIIEQAPKELQTDLKDLFMEMEKQQTFEAKLYKAIDKLEALIQHNESDLSTWLPLEYDLQMTYGTNECSFHETIQAIRDMVRDDSKQKAGMQ